MKLTKLRLEFDEIIGYNNREFNDILWTWVKRNANNISNLVEAPVKPEIAVLEKKIEGYKKIVQFIIDNHWKFGDMEQQLLTKIEKVGEKYDL